MSAAAPEVAPRQSRIGRRSVVVPKGVDVKFDATKVNVKGPKGALEIAVPPLVSLTRDGEELNVVVDAKAGTEGAKFQGLLRSLVQNMVLGVTEGYTRSLDLYGVGYRAEMKGKDLLLNLGLSHQIKYPVPEVVSVKIEILDEGGTKRPRIHLSSCDKQLLGQAAARIRSFRPPEPYKGKGVRYTGEKIKIKAGKAGAKA
jgi:large subunit ribosomal protein L6